jgi:hypothetical protein
MPSRAFVAAAPARSFNVWPIATLDEGVALLTGRATTAIHARAEARLAEFAALMREFADRRR